MGKIEDSIGELKKYFNYGAEDFSSPIPENSIRKITTDLLDALGFSKDVYIKFNTFFVLLYEYHYLEQKKLSKESAYICYLISYYLFMPFHPPSSWELSKVYADKAITLDEDNLEYVEWRKYIEKGN